MKSTLLLAGLLLFAALPFASAEEQAGTKTSTILAQNTNATKQILAYYFHGTMRCETCLEIEKKSRTFIENRYAVELSSRRLVFDSLNYDLKENAHFTQDYTLPFPSLVLIRQDNGRDTKWKMLGETWNLVKDPAAFGQYVEKEVNAYLDELGKSAAELATTNAPTTERVSDSVPGTKVESLDDMNARFDDLNAALVFVHSTNSLSHIDWAPINRARRSMQADWEIKVGAFELKPGQSDYSRLALRLPAFQLPAVMVVLRNGATTLVTGELTETNLVQEFIYSVSAAGCCPFGEH